MTNSMFCPKCGSILTIKGEDKKKKFSCANCGYTPRVKNNLIIKEKVKLDKAQEIEVRNKKIETLPKIKAECKKCNNSKAYYWLVQTRSSDEAETRFFECTKCGYRWREYK